MWKHDIMIQTTINLTTTGGTVWKAAQRACSYLEASAEPMGLCQPGIRVGIPGTSHLLPIKGHTHRRLWPQHTGLTSRQCVLRIILLSASSNVASFRDPQVLELGAGCGFLGLTIARNLPAAAEVCLTEQEDGGALDHLRLNVQQNIHLPGIQCVTVAACDWCVAASHGSRPPIAGPVCFGEAAGSPTPLELTPLVAAAAAAPCTEAAAVPMPDPSTAVAAAEGIAPVAGLQMQCLGHATLKCSTAAAVEGGMSAATAAAETCTDISAAVETAGANQHEEGTALHICHDRMSSDSQSQQQLGCSKQSSHSAQNQQQQQPLQQRQQQQSQQESRHMQQDTSSKVPPIVNGVVASAAAAQPVVMPPQSSASCTCSTCALLDAHWDLVVGSDLVYNKAGEYSVAVLHKGASCSKPDRFCINQVRSSPRKSGHGGNILKAQQAH